MDVCFGCYGWSGCCTALVLGSFSRLREKVGMRAPLLLLTLSVGAEGPHPNPSPASGRGAQVRPLR
ncbi:hypothetical protein LG3211_0870 [Lysobacter gummosus]|nr:hypothetical protein LG3211_0870 [Lysobacter gummosus]